MLTIKFSERWGKLNEMNFKTGELFTTFRGYNPKKDKWYKDNIGNIYDVDLNGKTIGTARLITVNHDWSTFLTKKDIQRDTYDHWTKEEFEGFLNKMYGSKEVFLIKLTFQVEGVM